MSKKIFMLLFLMLVLMSMAAVSAVDVDNNNDTFVSSGDAEAVAFANDVSAIDDLNEGVVDSDGNALEKGVMSIANDDVTIDDGMRDVGGNDLGSLSEDDVLKASSEIPIQSDVKKDVNLTADYHVGIYGINNGLGVHVKDKEGNNVTGGSITFVDVFGKNYTTDVNDGFGFCRVFVGQTGTFNITCSYSGNDVYNNANTTLLLHVPVADTACTNIVATRYGDTVYFSGNVVSNYTPYQEYGDFDDKEEVTEGNVTVYVNGERLGVCDVDINGNFVYIWKTTQNLIGQTINFTGSFSNELKHFTPSNFSKKFTFEAPKATEISYERQIIDENDILITGVVDDGDGNHVTGGTITIDGTYSVPVDANGKFSFHVVDKTPNKANYTIGVMDFGSKADITINEPLMNGIRHTDLVDELIELCKQGSPYIRFGNGNGKTIVINVGTHGGELASQVAGFKLIDLLANYGDEINGTIYVFPVIFPEATANNVRVFNMTNLNAIANVNGSISNNLVRFAQSVNATGLGDFHCTRHSDSDVGITCAMCSLKPTYESYLIAEFIINETGYVLDTYQVAGVPYAGAIEDYCNILGIPAITSESLTNHRAIEYGSPEVSFNMMRAFLKYFGHDINDMIEVPRNGSTLSVKFESPYNYNSSSKTVELLESASITAKSASYVINYGGKYSVTLKDSKQSPIAGKSLTFTLNGKKIGSATTNAKGIATIKITSKALKTAKAGKKNLVIEFAGKNYKSVSKTVKITVNKEKTKISANAITATYNVNKNLVITLKDDKGNAISGISITVNLNGAKTYTTNKNGKVIINVAKLVPKSYTAKITFAGSNNYVASSATVKVTVKKAKSKIIPKKKTFKAKTKVKKYTIKLKSGKTPIKKVTVTLKIKGKKIIKAKTNKKGKATFKIKKLTKNGIHKTVIKFKGNKYYKKATKKANIEIK